jgi:hypothetical protein
MSKLGTTVDDTITDQMDILMYKKDPDCKVFALARQRERSLLLVSMLNYLG